MIAGVFSRQNFKITFTVSSSYPKIDYFQDTTNLTQKKHRINDTSETSCYLSYDTSDHYQSAIAPSTHTHASKQCIKMVSHHQQRKPFGGGAATSGSWHRVWYCVAVAVTLFLLIQYMTTGNGGNASNGNSNSRSGGGNGVQKAKGGGGPGTSTAKIVLLQDDKFEIEDSSSTDAADDGVEYTDDAIESYDDEEDDGIDGEVEDDGYYAEEGSNDQDADDEGESEESESEESESED